MAVETYQIIISAVLIGIVVVASAFIRVMAGIAGFIFVAGMFFCNIFSDCF